jgi:hypothetical protein
LLQTLGDPKAVAYPERLLEGVRIQKAPLSARIKEYAMGGATVAAVPFMAADFARAAEAFASGHPILGFVQTGMGAFDWVFFRAFHQTYIDAYRANRGLGETRRQNRWVDGLNRPLKGAEPDPTDPTKPRLVNRGFLKTFAPALVLAIGMDGRVLLGYAAQTDLERAADAASRGTAGQWPAGAPFAANGGLWPFDETPQEAPEHGDLTRMTPQEFAAVLRELGFPQLPQKRNRRTSTG